MDHLEEIRKRENAIFRLEEILALLSWDQETGMPAGALSGRADQMAWIQQELTNKITDPVWETLIGQFGDTRSEKAWKKSLYRRYNLNNCLPSSFMAEFVNETSLARGAWARARKEKNFSIFHPHLDKVVRMSRERARFIGFESEPYNALLDLYEPGVTADQLDALFSPLHQALLPLIDKGRTIQKFSSKKIPGIRKKDQELFHYKILDLMGYDRNRGRMDFSLHPFTTTLGPGDVRITTHLDDKDFMNGLFSTVHEAGHALYEQNLPQEWVRTLNGQACSLGMHESQSRLWENTVGRSQPFWEFLFPMMKKSFPGELNDFGANDLFRLANRIEPGLIRIDADEYTYNLHIILRFRLERMIINGEAEAADLPELWNLESERLLGIRPENPAEGVLQDIHWSLGDWGYFPTYTLGNLYSAQIWKTAEKEIPDLYDSIRQGDFKVLLSWLARNIHSEGSLKSSDELIQQVTGEKPDSRFFIKYLKEKADQLYVS